ncbi:hypothetical protein RHMOL_Rhmol10G0147300 [Rhododendron molle]|uniref:Uncharacterized protein n=1 Tax=Rhododendron molle TaxID=49168 RepID=A0ACC0M2F3_RHOML|nr:hypothetical protein RHMOL_Rhmol10G0147300 [Rhododendron molle]
MRAEVAPTVEGRGKSHRLLNNNESKEVILQTPPGVPSEPKGKAPKGLRGECATLLLRKLGNFLWLGGLGWR